MKGKILLIEDDAIIAEDLKILFEKAGYEVAEIVSNAKEGADLAERFSPDIAIVDIVLREGNGIEVAREIIRELNIPVIFITAYPDPKTLERALEVKPYGYLVKPFENRELLGLVKVSLERAKAEKRLRFLKKLLEVLNQAREKIIRIKDRERVARELCYKVFPRFSPTCAMIIFDENQDPIFYEVNLGAHTEKFKEYITQGKIPECLLSDKSELSILKDKNYACKDCPLKELCVDGMLLLRFIGGGKLHGALYLSIPQDLEEEDILYFKGFAQDIALALENLKIAREKEEAFASLQGSLSFMKAMFSSMVDMIFAFDEEGRFTFVHAPRQEDLLMDKESIIEKHPQEILPENLWKKFSEAFEKNRNGEIAKYEYKIEIGGEEKWYSVSQSPIFSGDVFSGAVAIVREITERKKLEEELREREKRYRSLFENVPIGLYRTTPEGKLITANPAFVKILGFDSVDEIRKIEVSEFFAGPLSREEWKKNLEREGILETEYRLKTKNGRIIWVKDFTRVIREGDKTYYEGAMRDITAQKEDEEKLERSIKIMQRLFNQTVNTLGKVVEMRDPYTAGHQIRVAELAVAIAKEMGFKDEKLEAVRISALLHDIGKIAIPAEILVKPGPLTPEETKLVELHPTISYKILSKIDFPWPVAEIVYQHHERMDGSGYPRRLKGGGIMKEARILAVADVVEAMSSHRPYRPAYGLNEALDEISRGRGKLYDPEVVEACLKVFEKGFKFTSDFFRPKIRR